MKHLGIGIIAITIAGILWASDGIFLRPSLYSLPVTLVVFLEHLLGLVVLTPIARPTLVTLRTIPKKAWYALIWVALFGGVIGTLAITKALFYVDYVNLSIVVVLQKLQPVFALMLAGWLLKERRTRQFWLWAGVAIISTYVVTFGFSIPQLDHGTELVSAASLALLAAFAWGSSTVFSKHALQYIDFKVAAWMRFGMTTLVMLGVVVSMGTISNTSTVSSSQWLVLLIITFTTGAGALVLYNFGLKKVSASIATLCELSFPIAAIILEFFVHNRLLSMSQFVAVVVLVAAVTMAVRSSSNLMQTQS